MRAPRRDRLEGYSSRLFGYGLSLTDDRDQAGDLVQEGALKALITTHESGHEVQGRSLAVGGQAWAGDRKVAAMEVTIDFGATWIEANLQEPPNPYSWQRWTAQIAFPGKGYLNNTRHRIAVRVAA